MAGYGAVTNERKGRQGISLFLAPGGFGLTKTHNQVLYKRSFRGHMHARHYETVRCLQNDTLILADDQSQAFQIDDKRFLPHKNCSCGIAASNLCHRESC